MKWTVEFVGYVDWYTKYRLHPVELDGLLTECLDHVLEHGGPGDVVDENGTVYSYEDLVESRRLDEEFLD